MTTPLKSIDLWDDGVFNLIAHMGNNHHRCTDNKIQDYLIGLYRRLVLTEIKAAIIQVFSDVYQSEIIGDFDLPQIRKPKETVSLLNAQLSAYTKAVSSALKTLNPTYFRYCDSSVDPRLEDVSSIELSGFFQQVMFWYETPFCSASCSVIWSKRACERDWFDERSGCGDGSVMSCEWLNEVTACPSTEDPSKYRWVSSTQLGDFGDHSYTCPRAQQIRTNMGLAISRRACHCQCVRRQWEVYTGLFESNTSDNYVITGLRFRKKDNILFLQPAQGKLHANGYIVDSTWIDLPDPVQIQDFAPVELTRRTFFLDDINLGPKYVVTGIRLRDVQRGSPEKINGFAISISGRPLDYKTGKLDLTPSKERIIRVFGNNGRELVYKRVRPHDADIFKRVKASSPGFTYITLQQSELAGDYGQSTLPLFDSTAVVMKKHSPLNGIALFHRGSEKNAGFISVKLRPINYLPYLEDLMEVYGGNVTIARNL